MNTAEQILRKRCQSLERREAWLEDVVRALLRDLEFTESVGAAFAFDVQQKLNNREAFDLDQITLNEIESDCAERWDEAVKTLEAEQKDKT